jgi:hypothetical protein
MKFDTLGPQWKKAELERFYKAYRENGKNWKKVCLMCYRDSIPSLYFLGSIQHDNFP